MKPTFNKLLSIILLFSIFIISTISFLPTSEAHILVIGDSKGDLTSSYNEAFEVAKKLESKGYEVLALYRDNATTKNILKGMYDADAVIYAGHGGYQSGNYDNNGGIASSPFALVASDDFIWGIGDKMREGWTSQLFTAPFKQNIPVILLHSCFSTGWVGTNEVSNPIETIYNFASMFTGANANYYATAWDGADIIDDFLDGAVNFGDANNKNYEVILKSTLYNNTPVWRNDHGYAAFIGDWAGIFPSVTETTAYDDEAAEAWYNGDRNRNLLTSKFSVSSSPYYINQAVTFTDLSNTNEAEIINYNWDFGDGNQQSSQTSINPSHSFTSPGNYNVKLTVTDINGKTASSTKIVNVINRKPVANFYLTSSKVVANSPVSFISTSYDPDQGDKIVTCNWNFGDGSTGSGENVQHTYSKNGTYTVTLTVKDSFGQTSSKSIKQQVGTVIKSNPDLFITGISKKGNSLYVRVKNKGTAPSRSCYTKVWRSYYVYKKYYKKVKIGNRYYYKRYYKKIKKTYSKRIYIKPLNPGSSKTYKIYFKYRHGKAKVDYTNKVLELNEKNNVRSF
ncbi:MAG: PKD domain-containing protein [Methanomicrobiales archaeon]